MASNFNLNRYYKHSHISEAKFRVILKHFCYDATAERIALETEISRQSVLLILGKIRVRISQWCEEEERMSGEVEVGTPIGVFFAQNPAEIGGTGEQTVNRSEGRNPAEWIADWQSGLADEDDEVMVEQVGLVFPTSSSTTGASTP